MEFTTFDADHDEWTGDRNCATERSGGFWWYRCGSQNINGRYNESNWGKKIRWDWYRNLQKTQMMIRTAAKN